MRTIFCERSHYCNRLAELQRISRPTSSQQTGRGRQFDLPIRKFAVGILRVHVEASVWIDPFNLRYGPRERHWFIPIELRRKGMMANNGNGGQQRQAEHSDERERNPETHVHSFHVFVDALITALWRTSTG